MVERKNKKFKSFQDSFQYLFATKNWRNQWELFQLYQNWSEIVGEQTAAVTKPAFFRRDVLYIYVENSSWMQQVQFMKPDLRKKIDQALDPRSLSDIRWLLQPGEEKPLTPARPQPRWEKVDSEQCSRMKQMLQCVDNDECRKALYSLWHSSQARVK